MTGKGRRVERKTNPTIEEAENFSILNKKSFFSHVISFD